MSEISIFIDGYPDPRTIYVLNDKAYFKDTNEEVPEKFLSGFKHLLFGRPVYEISYNAKMCANITNTPYSFWLNASDETKARVQSLFQQLARPLQEIRNSTLAKTYEVRSQKANSKRWENSK